MRMSDATASRFCGSTWELDATALLVARVADHMNAEYDAEHAGHGHSHGGQPCGGHGHGHHGHAHAEHGHSHGGKPCSGHH